MRLQMKDHSERGREGCLRVRERLRTLIRLSAENLQRAGGGQAGGERLPQYHYLSGFRGVAFIAAYVLSVEARRVLRRLRAGEGVKVQF